MTKLNKIEKTLLEMEGGAFQKLANAFLRKRGYENIVSIGSVPGSDKTTTGTPDTLMPRKDGTYDFAEHTTKQSGVFSKFKDDIEKCFDEAKTGIKVALINEIVLMFNSEMSTGQIAQLGEMCQDRGVNLVTCGLSAIANDLLVKYPNVCMNHLGIEVDTGQIVELEDFIDLYQRSALATSLETAFHFRKQPLIDLKEMMNAHDLVVVTGHAGVGKTRLVIEAYNEFLSENEDYKAYCIYNKGGIDIYDDLRAYFSEIGNYLIFVDDANRVSGFKHIVNFLETKRDGQNFKIIVTVRDYAIDHVRESCKSLGVCPELNVEQFTDEEITELMKEEFGIQNTIYLDRITEVTQGNARLAVMAAKIVLESRSLESIRDVSELYNVYYASIKDDLSDLGNNHILKVCGIIAFHRSVDMTNDDLMSTLEIRFQVSPSEFMTAARKLHDMEIVDMFEGEVAKIADQVLATYLLYLVFFKEKLLDFGDLIVYALPRYRQKLIEAINPIMSVFGHNEIKEELKRPVESAWAAIKSRGNGAVVDFLKLFWFVKETDALHFVKSQIDGLEREIIPTNDISFECKQVSDVHEFMQILLQFRYIKDKIGMSLDLIFRYTEKLPSKVPDVIYLLVEHYGIQPESMRYGYFMERALIEKIIVLSRAGNEIFTRIFIVLSENYLRTQFSRTRSGKGQFVNVTNFKLEPSEQLFDLREIILTHLFEAYENVAFKPAVFKIFHDYVSSGYAVSEKAVVEHDMQLVLPFLQHKLASGVLSHGILAKKYEDVLNRLAISFDEAAFNKFNSNLLEFYNLVFLKHDKKEFDLEYHEFMQYKNDEMAKYIASYTKSDFDVLLSELPALLSDLEGREKWKIDEGVGHMFMALIAKDMDLYCEVVASYLADGDLLRLHPWAILDKLVAHCGPEKAFDIFANAEFERKGLWLFMLYQSLNQDSITPQYAEELLDLYRTVDVGHINRDLDSLLMYEAAHEGFVLQVIDIIITRAVETPDILGSLSILFNKHSKINDVLLTLFSGHVDVLKMCYLIVCRHDRSTDYDGATLSKLLDHDIEFIVEFIDYRVSNKDRYLSKYDDNAMYQFIWQRDDYESVMHLVVNKLFQCVEERLCFADYLSLFFTKPSDKEIVDEIMQKQNQFLRQEIDAKCDNLPFMRYLFAMITEFEIERKVLFHSVFLSRNSSFDDYVTLPLEPMTKGWSGSAIPMLQEFSDYYERLAVLCDTVDLLKHRQYIEERVERYRQDVRRERKREFTGDEW